MILEVHEEHYPLIEDKFKQEVDEVWFGKLEKNLCTFQAMYPTG